jgi:hypothetical protein
MRKFATFAALTLCAGTAVAGGASAASADVNIGTSTQGAGVPDFANTWCGAPWLWSGQPSATGCATRHHDPANQ